MIFSGKVTRSMLLPVISRFPPDKDKRNPANQEVEFRQKDNYFQHILKNTEFI